MEERQERKTEVEERQEKKAEMEERQGKKAEVDESDRNLSFVLLAPTQKENMLMCSRNTLLRVITVLWQEVYMCIRGRNPSKEFRRISSES